MFKCLVREVTKWFEWTAFYLLQMPASHLNMLLSCQKHRCINVECSTWQNYSLKYSSQYIFFKKQASKDAAYAIFKTFLKHQQTKIPFFVPLQFQAVIHEPVCIAVIHFVLAFLHSVKFKWNELGARAAVSLCRKYAIHFCYTSVLQCVLSLPYLQCATSLHLLTSLHRVHMLTWVGQNLGNES